jgi:glutathione peroxidase
MEMRASQWRANFMTRFSSRITVMSANLLSIPVTTIKGESKTLADFAGKAVLVVNTASKCGFTPQYEGLEKLWKNYKDQGLVVLGFPCNQFGKQEPGNEGAISEFCELNFGVSFPLFKKVDVNGSDAHPLFVQLKKQAPGLLGSERIKWNFTKFLIGKDGQLVKRFAPLTKPEDLKSEIEALLK